MNEFEYLKGQNRALIEVVGVLIATHPQSDFMYRLVDGLREAAQGRLATDSRDGYLLTLDALRREDLDPAATPL